MRTERGRENRAQFYASLLRRLDDGVHAAVLRGAFLCKLRWTIPELLPEHSAMRSIESELLTLEPQVAAHADEMFEVLGDPAIYRYENEPPVSREWLRTRFTRLESRRSGNGSEQWLNWVIRLRDGTLAGYVQATVRPDESAAVAYVLASPYWGKGIGSAAVRAMIGELHARYGVKVLDATLKRTNLPSQRLLERMGFELAAPVQHAEREIDADEILMLRDTASMN